MNEKPGDMQAVIDAVRSPSFLFQEGTPFAFVPNNNGGFDVKVMEDILPAPTRKRGNTTIGDGESMVAYLKRHGSTDCTMVYVAADLIAGTASIVAVINDHRKVVEGENPDAFPGWRDHVATYSPIRSVEWTRWTSNSSKEKDQLTFATFIEDNISDISNLTNALVDNALPSGSDMLKMATEFEANHDKRFKQKVNITGGGVQLEYVDDEEKDTRSRMSVFDRFKIGIRVFRGGDAFSIPARLRYRVQDGRVMFRYELIRPDQVFEAALKAEIEKIKGAGFDVIYGAPK